MELRIGPAARAAITISLLLWLGACGGLGRPSLSEIPRRKLNVEVRNYNFYDATIYAYYGGERVRLGMAQGKTTTSFDFHWDQGDLRFIIDFVGPGELVGERLPVESGDQLILIVGPEDHRRARRG